MAKIIREKDNQKMVEDVYNDMQKMLQKKYNEAMEAIKQDIESKLIERLVKMKYRIKTTNFFDRITIVEADDTGAQYYYIDAGTKKEKLVMSVSNITIEYEGNDINFKYNVI
jgi:hypothetical protein